MLRSGKDRNAMHSESKFGATEFPIVGELRAKGRILSTHNLRRKFAAVCRKIATSPPSYFFLTHDAAGSTWVIWAANIAFLTGRL